MKLSIVIYLTLFYCILSIACNPVCDETINKEAPYLLVCSDTSNLITEVTQSYQTMKVTSFKNNDGNDTVYCTVALDKPGTRITIQRKKSIDIIDYTLSVKKTFEPESDCADNNIVYQTDSLRISQTTCKNLNLKYISNRSWFFPFGVEKGWILTFE